MSSPPQALLVLGMHRSGTSALTRVLSLCGAALPATLMAPSETINPAGFWESEPLAHLHDEILESAGRSWFDLRPLPDAWFASPAADEFTASLGKMFDAQFPAAALTVIKDPRLCLLFPLWRRLLAARGINACPIIILRHPLDVAASLTKREGFSEARGLLLWLNYILNLERGTRDLPRCFVSYDELLADWRAPLARIGSIFAVNWPRAPDAAAPEIDAFLSSDLRHHQTATSALPAPIASAYAWLCTALADPAYQPALMDGLAATYPHNSPLGDLLLDASETDLAQRTKDLHFWMSVAVERYDLAMERLTLATERLNLIRALEAEIKRLKEGA